MPPIPIHKNSPIAPTTAAKADAITPETASSNNTATNPPPTRTTPAHVPATTTQSSSSPPAPQPGARPVASTAPVSSDGYNTNGIPAPPQPGPTATVVTTETRQIGPPPQFNRPPPSDSMLAGRSTVTTTNPTLSTASKPGPTTLNFGPAASPFQTLDSGNAVPQPTRTSLEHPPGYVQAPDNAPYTAGGGIGAPSRVDRGDGGQGEGVGAQAWQLLSKAGEALRKGEENVWKTINNKNGGGF
ncbi:hypothetical protein GGP41_008999 [Bipolaris sorokiniana]|uniref:Uncharacterized protein n=2 Tax=Cochliobolus sativus TaxID=45130 RepID=A0A8H5ZCI5_COCSA|nr:uncharacterized protein COCSADRAFT_246261 [Bipolaris sorokiniana ND90Pr]EMD59864.1 hypothetical protein COCSADRAFT_246261 [Bipolaris sorokiniana ND90Pr]KAF5847736.1 hypothetical protein GGP41_008999 [Bipolaris sorokiniana]